MLCLVLILSRHGVVLKASARNPFSPHFNVFFKMKQGNMDWKFTYFPRNPLGIWSFQAQKKILYIQPQMCLTLQHVKSIAHIMSYCEMINWNILKWTELPQALSNMEHPLITQLSQKWPSLGKTHHIFWLQNHSKILTSSETQVLLFKHNEVFVVHNEMKTPLYLKLKFEIHLFFRYN